DAKDWTLPPFELIEKDGGFFGRGVADDKDEAAIYVANLIRMKQEGYVPRRSIVVALTTDEEGGDFNGVRYLLDKHPQLLEAAFVFNEGGGGQLDETGRRMANTVQAAEKKFQNYTIVATNAGGHSSRPRPDNAIVELGKALQGITPTLLPVKLNAVTTEYLKRSADGRGGETGKAMAALAANPADAAALKVLEQDPALNAMIRSACVPTMIKGGHAQNALPQRAEATVNCRLVPDEDAKAVLGLITQATAGAKVTVTIDEERAASPASPIDGAVLATIDRVTQQMWKGVPVIPTMSTGATDSSPFREKGVPAYGVSGLFYGPESGAHGMNERVPVQSFYEGQEFLYRLAKEATVE
ncbi:MAG: M20/M25/M40 family metallo-hydrolase, partial [Pseudoxanthomonas sp.]